MLKQVGVYYQSQPASEDPSYYISVETARNMKKGGEGAFINHGKAFRLKAERNPDIDTGTPNIRDHSARMGMPVIEANADGAKWAQVLTEAWA